MTVTSLCTDCEKDYPEADCHRDAANLRQRAEDLESQLSAEVSARDLTIRDLRSERDEAIHIARDLLTWAEASGVTAGAVIEASSRLGKLRPRG